jgi:hypothetical protein
MASLVQAERLSDAWIAAMELLLAGNGMAVNLNVVFDAKAREDTTVTAQIDSVLADHGCWSVSTVANTIFPKALYHPHLGDDAAPRLYENYELSMRMHRRRPRDKETYFNRLIAYPIAPPEKDDPKFPLNRDGSWNQLRFYVERLRTQHLGSRRSSSYELGVSHPMDGELRLQAPFTDKRLGSFPCLSHISLTLVDGHVHMNATYRNQTFVTRAYGNYVGLADLLRFIATEGGVEPGEVQVVATHADADLLTLRATAVRELVSACRGPAASSTRAAAHV